MDAADAAFADVVCQQAAVDSKVDPPPTTVEHHSFVRTEKHMRRLDVNKRLGEMNLPELSLRATLKFPLSSKRNLKAKHGPQAILQRLAKRFQDADAYSELVNVVSEERKAPQRANPVNAVSADSYVPSAEKALQALETHGESQTSLVNNGDHTTHRNSVLPHPKLTRDDRPDFSAAYLDPYLTEPIDTYLWLPRDPLFSIDLDDTIGELCPLLVKRVQS